jgi:hypothetical protein
LLKYLSFIGKKTSQKIQDGAFIQHGDYFWQLFLRAFIFVRNFDMVKLLHFLKKQTQKKNKKICCQKINSKWPLNSRWLTKLNLLM